MTKWTDRAGPFQGDRSAWRSWPGWDRLRAFLIMAVWLDLLFIVVYGGNNWAASKREDVLSIYFDWELAIPLIPEMIFVYWSISILLVLPPFVLGVAEMRLLAKRVAMAILTSGVIFLLFPTRLGFPFLERSASHEIWFQVIYLLDRPHNLVPSLHIAYSTLIILALLRPSPSWARVIFWSWLVLICLSVVLVHQHHLADVLGGILVAWSSEIWVKKALI